jgi:Zn-dependent alcohol dehydrogenase
MEIVVVEPRANRRETAAGLGATRTVNPETVDDVSETVADYLGGRADYAFEAAGDLADIVEAVADAEAGEAIKPVLRM